MEGVGATLTGYEGGYSSVKASDVGACKGGDVAVVGGDALSVAVHVY